MTKKITEKVLKNLILDVLTEATEDKARAEAQKVLDANPNASAKDVTKAIRALGRADKTNQPSLVDARRIAKEIISAQAKPPQAKPPQAKPSKKIKITYPIFNFDLFTKSDMIKSGLGQYYKNQTDIYDMMHKYISTTSDDPVSRIKTMVNFLENPLQSMIVDMDKDAFTDDDAVSIAFSSILMFKLLENITNRNESSMGFYLENWIATMIGGKALQASAGSDWKDVELGTSGYSLKFVLPTSEVSQASLSTADEYKNNTNKKVPYLIALKDKKQPSKITFYSLTPQAKVIIDGIKASDLVKGEVPIATIDIAAINNKMNNLSSNSMTNVEEIYKNVESVLDEMSNLQAFLAFWYQNFSDASSSPTDQQELKDAADGIIISSKNCKNSIDFLSNKKLYKKGATFNKQELTNAAQQVLSKNKGLVMDERLPNINLTQAFTEQLTTTQVTDTVLEEISDTLSKITGSDLQETLLKRVQYIQNLYDQVLNNNINTNDISSLFNILILTQALFSFGALKASDVSTGNFGLDTHVGGATAGFTMEGLLGLLMSDGQTDPNARFQSFTAGGNQEKIDVAVIERVSNGKDIVHGFSSKFRVRDYYGDINAMGIKSLVKYKYNGQGGLEKLSKAYEKLDNKEKNEFVTAASHALSYHSEFPKNTVKNMLENGAKLTSTEFRQKYGRGLTSILETIRNHASHSNTRTSNKLDFFWTKTLNLTFWDRSVEQDPNLKAILTKFDAETLIKAEKSINTPKEQEIIKALDDIPAISDSGASQEHFVPILVGQSQALTGQVAKITPSTDSYTKYDDLFERQIYTLQQALLGSGKDDIYKMYSKKGKLTKQGKIYLDRGGNPKFDMSTKGFYNDNQRVKFFDILESTKQQVDREINNKYEFKSYIAGAASDDSGEFSLFSGEGEIGAELGRLSLSAGNFQKFIDNLETALKKVAVDFTSSFKNFNEFKISTGSFLQNPTAIGHAVCGSKYDAFKSHVNKVFSDTAVAKVQGTKAITEAVITAIMLQKLISESFKK